MVLEPVTFEADMTSAAGEAGISVMMELCQRVLDGKGMPDE